MVDLYIIRHAEAEGNLFRRLHGHYDGKLTQNGRRQVEALRAALSGVPFDVCYSSDLTRTMHTAAACGIEVIPTPALREISMGEWEDICMGDAYAADPDFELKFRTPDSAQKGGETMRDVYHRTQNALSDIFLRHDGERVAIVSHTCAIRAILAFLLHGTIETVGDLPFVPNASISRFEIEGGERRACIIGDDRHVARLPVRFPSPVPDTTRPFLRFFPAKNGDDVETCVALWRDTWIFVNGLADGFNYSYAHHEMSRIFRNNKNALRLAYIDDICVGALVLDTANLQEDDCGHISLFMLKEKFRGYGLGLQLLGEAVNFYRRLGRKYLRLRADRDNVRALRFYESNDFFVSGFDEAGDYIMKRPL